MKSRTSFFNTTALGKDITRFWPVWGMYSVGIIIVLLAMGDSGDPVYLPGVYQELLHPLGVINMIYGTVCALVLFGDLFNTRMCNALHAMPLRREGWYLVHIAAGLLFALIPNLVFSLISAFLLGKLFYLAFIALGVCMLQYLFFFSLATLCCTCSGSRFAAFVLSGMANFLSLLVYVFLICMYMPLLYGIRLPWDPFFQLCPVVQLTESSYINLLYLNVLDGYVWGRFLEADWYYLFACTGFSIVFLGLGALVYRKRHLETAGEFLSLRALRPVFLLTCTLGAGTLLYAIGTLYSGPTGYLFLAIGLTVGFFAAKMFLDRTVKVFHKKSFLGLAAVSALLAGSLLITSLDPFGTVNFVPETDAVESVQVIAEEAAFDYADYDAVTLTESEHIDVIRELHQQLLDAGSSVDSYHTLTLRYQLENGRTVTRYYDVQDEQVYDRLRPYFSSWQCVFGTEDWEEFTAKVTTIYCTETDIVPPEAYPQLLEALKKDCEAGNMAQSYVFHNYDGVWGWLDINLAKTPASDSIAIYESCTNTIAVLKEYAN